MDTGPASDPSAARGQSSAVIRRQARPTGGAPGKGRETRPAGRGAGKGSAIADANGKGKGKGKRKGKGKGVARSSRSSRGGGGEGDGEGDSYGTLGKLVSKATTPSRETGYKYLDEVRGGLRCLGVVRAKMVRRRPVWSCALQALFWP